LEIIGIYIQEKEEEEEEGGGRGCSFLITTCSKSSTALTSNSPCPPAAEKPIFACCKCYKVRSSSLIRMKNLLLHSIHVSSFILGAGTEACTIEKIEINTDVKKRPNTVPEVS
jgi:hypothetical protein